MQGRALVPEFGSLVKCLITRAPSRDFLELSAVCFPQKIICSDYASFLASAQDFLSCGSPLALTRPLFLFLHHHSLTSRRSLEGKSLAKSQILLTSWISSPWVSLVLRRTIASNSMDLNLGKFKEIVRDCCAAVHGVTKSWTQLSKWTTGTIAPKQLKRVRYPKHVRMEGRRIG